MTNRPRTARFSYVILLITLTALTGLAITATTAGAAGVRFGFVDSVASWFGGGAAVNVVAEPQPTPESEAPMVLATVFSDDFSTNASATYTTSGSIGASAWSVSRAGDDWGARRSTSPLQLELTNDAGAATNANGWVFAHTSTSSFLSPYVTTLSSNPGVVTWEFNIRQIRPDPAGFGSSSSYGAAFILATNTTSPNVGAGKVGYAVTLGEAGSVDPVHLSKFSGGLQSGLTPIIDSNTTGLTDFGAEYLSVRVTYNPTSNVWELFLRNDGASAFADPSTGTLVSQGTVVDSTYTGMSLTSMGAYWQGSTAAAQTAFFDNTKVAVDLSAPTTQASNITFASVTTNSMTVNWTNGNGSKRIVKMNTSNSFTDPVDGTDPTGASTVYGGGEQLIYNNTGSSVAVTGLAPATTYWFRVYEANGSGSTVVFNTATATNNPNSQITSPATTSLANLTVNTTEFVGNPLSVTTTLTRTSAPAGPVSGATVVFTLTDPSMAVTTLNGVTNVSGEATVNFSAFTTQGAYTINASFAGNSTLAPSTSNTPTVSVYQRTLLTLTPASGTVGVPLAVSATLTRVPQGTPIQGQNVTFDFGGTPANLSATTNASGVATVNPTFATAGTFPTTASFLNTAGFFANNAGNLVAETSTANITVASPTETTVTLSGGNLLIEDINGGTSNDNIIIACSGANITITDSGNGLNETIPLASVTGSITVNTNAGNDKLTVDLSGCSFIPAGGLFFNGGDPTSGTGDSLVVTGGGPYASVTHTASSASSGSVNISGVGLITYTGLEPVTDNLSAVDRVFTFTGGDETITVTDGTAADGMTMIDSTLSESIYFANPSNSLTINAGTGDDIININSVDAGLNRTLIINGDAGNDTVNIMADITFAANHNLDIDLSNDAAAGDVDTIDVLANANLILSGTGTANLSASRRVLFATGSSLVTVDGALTLNANQQLTPTTGNFTAIDINGANVQATGTGAVTINGRGGSTGSGNNGVLVYGGSTVRGGTSGNATLVTGTGGAATSTTNLGVLVITGGTISSFGGNVSVTGTGGSGTGGDHHGVRVFNSGTITAGGTGTVTVMGTGGSAAAGGCFGVDVRAGSATISSGGGDVSVTGQGGACAQNVGVAMTGGGAAVITSGGMGSVSVTGTGGNGGSNNDGINIFRNAQITSGGAGNLVVNATGGNGSDSEGIQLSGDTSAPAVNSGGGTISVTGTSTTSVGILLGTTCSSGCSIASGSNAAVSLISDSINLAAGSVSAGSGAVTVRQRTNGVAIDLGSASNPSAGPLSLTDAEIGRITAGTLNIGNASSGAITFSAHINLTDSPVIGTCNIQSGGSIVDGNAAAGPDISVANLRLVAGNAIGAVGAGLDIDLSVDALTTLSSGTQFLSEANSLTVGSAGMDAGANEITLRSGRFNTASGGGNISRGVNVNSGATLGGNGTAGALGLSTISSGGTVSPGTSPGILSMGPTVFSAGSTFAVELNGTTPGSGYDQLNATGAVDLGGATLSLTSTFSPTAGDTFVIINNVNGGDDTIGLFNGTADGSTIPNVFANGYGATINYNGGGVDANDVVLTATAPPPTIITSTPGPLNFGSVTVGNFSPAQSYTVSGAGLVNDLTVTAPGHYQVSQSPTSGFGGSVILTPTSGTVSTTTIYIRFAPTGTGAPLAGNVTNASSPATTQNVAVTGTGVAAMCVAPPSGIRAQYRAENNFNDSTGSFNATGVGTPTFAAGRIGQAFDLNGTTQYVLANPATTMETNPRYSFDGWFYRRGNNNGTAFEGLVVKEFGPADSFSTFIFDNGTPGSTPTALSDDRFHNIVAGAPSFQTAPGSVPPVNTWFHIAQTYDGSTIRFYLNGVQIATQALVGRAVGSGPLAIGNRNGGNHPFNGLIDEVEVYDRTLSAAEVQARYNSGPASGMVAWFSGEGDANDRFGVNNGTLQNGAIATGSGKVGQSFSLDGSNDFVNVPDSAGLNPSTAITMDAWVNADVLKPSALIFTKDDVGAGQRDYLLQLVDDDIQFVVFTNPSSAASATTTTGPIAPGTWYHIAATYSTTDGARIFVNGVQVATGVANGTIRDTATPLRIGSTNEVGQPRFFDGRIDEVQVFDRVLSGSEIAAIYNASSAGKCLAPEIAVEEPVGTDLVDNVSTTNFGNQGHGTTSAARTYTIRNRGTTTLNIASVTKDGANNADFTIDTTGMSLSVAPNGLTAFTVTFTPGGVGTRTAALHIATDDSDENPFDIGLTGNGTPVADLAITKTDGVTTAVPGQSVTYTIVASNAGPSTATGVTVTDTFPAVLTCSTTSVAAGGATGNTAGPFAGNISDTAISLPVGGSVTYTSNCSINASATGTLTNTATVSSAIPDPVPGNNSATDIDTLTPQTDLAITKTDGVTTAVPGASVTYTIVASNAGPSTATGVTVADTFAAILTCSTTSVAAGGATGNTAGPFAGNINNTGMTMPPGSNITYTSVCQIAASATGTLVNTATVSSATTDPVPGNNSATDTDTLTPQADLAITKTDGVTTVQAGLTTVYTIVASNAGPSDVTGATVTDTFPAGISSATWTCVGAGGGACTASGTGNISDTVNLPAGGSVTYTVTATISISATGTLANTATVAVPGGVTDTVPGNNSATDTNTVTPCVANPIIVTNNANDGVGSLRRQVAIACPGSTITFDMGTVVSPILLSGGQIVIDKNLTITGPGANALTVQNTAAASNTSRVFVVLNDSDATVSGLTISGGNLSGANDGGGIINLGTGTLTIDRSTMSANVAGGRGGGILSVGPVEITSTTISGNSTGQNGGGLHLIGGGLIVNSTISGNTSGSGHTGGGVYVDGGGLAISNSTIANNTSPLAAGASGVFVNSGTPVIRSTIIAGNVNATMVADVAGMFTSQGYNLIGNVGTATGFTGTGDQTGTGASPLDPRLLPLDDNGGPTETHALCLAAGVPAGCAGLSPAVDKGDDGSVAATTDQRGEVRPIDNPSIPNATGGDGSDIGAFEVQNTPPTITPTVALTRQQSSPVSNSGIATVSDAETPNGSLVVTVNGGATATVNGVTLSNIVNTSGAITANIVASCTATNATFTLRVTDGGGLFTEATLTVTVTANTPPTLSYATQTVVAGTTPTFSPATGPSDNGTVASIALTSITPNTGLTLSVNNTPGPNYGQVTVTSATIAGSYTVQITATDNCGVTTVATFTINVTCPTVTVNPPTLSNGTVNQSYTQTITASPAGGSYTFAVTSGSLPSGLNLNPTTGVLSGTPTTAGTFNFRITATGFGSCTGFRDYTVVIGKANTATTVAASPSSSVFGQSVTFTATVSTTPSGPTIPTGAVSFIIDGNIYCANTPMTGPTATCTQAGLPALPAGVRNVVALYSGDTNFNSSAGTLNYTVNKANTTTTISSHTPDPSLVNQPYTVTWTVVPNPVQVNSGSPTGTVTVNGGTGGGSCTAPVASGGCQLTPTTPGVKSITATYNGDANFNASPASDAVTHTVNVQISGTIRQAPAMTPIAGVVVNTTGACGSNTATTNSSGVFTLVLNGGFGSACTVTPQSGLFDPISRRYTVTDNITGANFTRYNSAADIPRTLSLPTQFVVPGATGSMPVMLDSQNNEAFLSFTILYPFNQLSTPTFVCGPQAPGCTITTDTSVLGRVGVTLIPAGGAFSRQEVSEGEAPMAQKQVATMNFSIAIGGLPNAAISFVNSPVNLLTQDAASNPLLTRYVDGLIVFAQGIEGDVAGRNAGNGAFESADVVQTRRFVVGLDIPVDTHNEFMRADTAPASTRGDGVLNATDVIQTRRYVTALDPGQAAGGPGAPGTLRSAPRGEGERAAAAAAAEAESEITIGDASGSTNSRVSVPVGMRSNGDVLAVSFVVRYDAARLGNAAVELAGSPDGVALTANTNEPGVIRVLVDSVAPFARSKDLVALVNVSFDIAGRAPTGDTRILIEETTISDERANPIGARAADGTISIAGPNAVSVEISGRVTTPDGAGLRNAPVTLTDSKGLVQTVTTGSLGYYRFGDVVQGETYTINVESRRFQVDPQTVRPTAKSSSVDMRARE